MPSTAAISVVSHRKKFRYHVRLRITQGMVVDPGLTPLLLSLPPAQSTPLVRGVLKSTSCKQMISVVLPAEESPWGLGGGTSHDTAHDTALKHIPRTLQARASALPGWSSRICATTAPILRPISMLIVAILTTRSPVTSTPLSKNEPRFH